MKENIFSFFKIKNLLILISGGFVSTIALILIISNRWNLLDSKDTIFLILFFQWQLWGVTISKIGIDQTLFAMITKNKRLTLNYFLFIKNKIIPISFIYSLIMLFFFEIYIVLILFLSILLDSISMIIISELNARGKYKKTTLSNILNYPLFFCFLLILSNYFLITLKFSLLLFLFASLIRFFFLIFFHNYYRGNQFIVSNINVEMGIQQTLNYLLYRSDQLILTFILLNSGLSIYMYTTESYLFLAKLPELISRVVVYIGIVFFPYYYIKYPLRRTIFLNLIIIIFFSTLIISVISLLFLKFWNYDIEISWLQVFPFIINSILILPTHMLVYSFLRQHYVKTLIRNLLISIIASYFLCIYLSINLDKILLVWIVPFSLFIFIIISLCFNWGKKKISYEIK